jgi:hypothetical protein
MKPRLVFAAVLVSFAAGLAMAQQPAPTPTPPKGLPPELLNKIKVAPSPVPQTTGTPAPEPTLLPGEDPWEDYMKHYYDVQKFPKQYLRRTSPTVGIPFPNLNVKMEIVDEDEEYVYMRNLPIEDPESAAHKAWWGRQAMEIQSLKHYSDSAGHFILDPLVEYPAPMVTDRLHFEEHSQGLPTQGRWQMGLAVGDINEDGKLDMVFPPARLGTPNPWIVLQTADGWQRWDTVKWPDIKFDYGDVGVADFDGDGHLDIVITCHFLRTYVLYGNGKGEFTRYAELPRIGKKITSRALVVADFNHDGRPDVAELAELDLDMATNVPQELGLLQVILNTKDGWQAVEASKGAKGLYGDHLAVGDVDGDGKPDLVVSSHKNQNDQLVFLNNGDGRSWTPVVSPEFPYLGYVFGPTTGRMSEGAADSIGLAMFQNVRAGGKNTAMNGVLIYDLTRKADKVELKRRIVAVDQAQFDNYTCATIADVDGDGKPDLLVGRRVGGVEVYLQGPGGQLMREKSPELDFGDAYINAIKVVALANGDRAMVVMTSDGSKTAGSVRAFVARKGPLDNAVAGR